MCLRRRDPRRICDGRSPSLDQEHQGAEAAGPSKGQVGGMCAGTTVTGVRQAGSCLGPCRQESVYVRPTRTAAGRKVVERREAPAGQQQGPGSLAALGPRRDPEETRQGSRSKATVAGVVMEAVWRGRV